MGFSGDFAMEVVSVLEDYDATMDRLTELILPYSQRLEQKLQEYPWLMEGMGEYWASRFLTMKPEAFLEDQTGLGSPGDCRAPGLLLPDGCGGVPQRDGGGDSP